MPDSTSLDIQRSQAGQRPVAIFALIVVNALWGLSFPLMKSLNQQVDDHFQVSEQAASASLRMASASGMIAVRFAIALVLLSLLWRSLLRHASPAQWRAGLWIGFFFYIGLVFQVIGLATIPASRSGFLTSLTTVFTPLFAWIIWRRRPSVNLLFGVVLALLGVSILTGLIVRTAQGWTIAADVWKAWTVGDTLTTVGAVFFTGQVLLIDHFGQKLESSAFTPGMFAAIVLLATATFAVSAPTVDVPGEVSGLGLLVRPSFVGLIFVLAFFCSLLSFSAMNKYQPHITASQASVIYSLEPVFASSWALFVPGWIGAISGLLYENERWSEPLVVGGTLILLANIVALWPSRRRDPSAATSI